ncbi:MAG: response regulator [Methylophilaceae bacterium]|nr:response regulator [Methylophilaceae bacterium]
MTSMQEMEVKQSKILIVDDEPANVALLHQMLDQEGYTYIQSTTDPREVESLQLQHHFDLILLDIRMPHMSGIEVMQKLFAFSKREYLPVLVLTAQLDEETRKQALQAGACDFITKPFAIWEVLLRIRNALHARIYYKHQRLRGDEMEQLLWNMVQTHTQELHHTQIQLVECLGRAGEYRDTETGAHVTRMSRACQMLAKAIGWNDARAELLLYASQMHDLGKIGIPDHILNKPGKLDEKERRIINTHTTIGAEIIGNSKGELMQMARIVALHHHEKWDGCGYPYGLSGENIPIEARIVALCDVFDALTSSRPYKPGWPLEKAVDFIRDQSGKHFDPTLAPVFLALIPEIQALRDAFPDTDDQETSE